MTREIKFRVWDGVQKAWQYLFLERGGVRFLYTKNTPIAENCERWLQFTGLKDKNGKEIYEGDVIHYDEPMANNPQTGTIIYSVGDAGFVMEHSDYLPPLKWNIEIIGNVHESPELLTPNHPTGE